MKLVFHRYDRRSGEAASSGGFDLEIMVGHRCFYLWFAPGLSWRGRKTWRKLAVGVFNYGGGV